MDEEKRGPIFDGVRYTIIPSDDLPSDKTRPVGSGVGFEPVWLHVLTDAKLRECLDDEGAEFVALSENGTIPALEHLSHIISTHIDFPQYTSALSLGKDVIRPMWVHVSVKKEKMTNARPYSPDPSQYFQDVVLTSATLPEGDKEAIMAGVLALGGQFSNPLTKLCTHI